MRQPLFCRFTSARRPIISTFDMATKHTQIVLLMQILAAADQGFEEQS